MFKYKRQKFDPEHYQTLTGTKTEVEMPKDALIDLWVEWYSSAPLVVNLIYATGLVVPYATAASGSFNLQTLNLLSVLFEKDKNTNATASVQFKDLAQKEKGDWTPVEIAPPPALSVQLSSLISEQVRRQLEVAGVSNEKIDLSAEDDLEEDVPEEFGSGYMEDEEPKPKRKRAAKPPAAPPAPESGGTAPDVSSGSKPDREPETKK